MITLPFAIWINIVFQEKKLSICIKTYHESLKTREKMLSKKSKQGQGRSKTPAAGNKGPEGSRTIKGLRSKS
jgi:hypothetical protein